MDVDFTAAAIADLTWIRGYLARFNPSAARHVAERIKQAALSLAAFPNRGRMRPDGARELVAVWPYVIVYDVAPNRVTILRVWHGAQNREGP